MSSNQLRVLRTKKFRRDVRRMDKSNRYDLSKLKVVIDLLRSSKSLPDSYRDHALVGELLGHRECHIEGNWLLIYRVHQDVLVLELIRTGTHAQLFNE